MKKCATCRHALPLYEESFDGSDIDVKQDYCECTAAKHVGMKDSGDEIPNGKAGTADGSGYYAALLVTDEFGCVMHEGRE
jgi:hypothetical protein